MIIQWLGQSAFKIQGKDVLIAIDPHDKTGLKMPKFQADLLLISRDTDAHNNLEAVKGDPFIIDGAGEYEVKNVFVYGLRGVNKEGVASNNMTLYLVEFEGIKIAHLSDLNQDTLTERQMEYLEGVDILLLPVGGLDTIDSTGAVKIISQIQPRIVIPMHYKLPGLKDKLDGVDKFLKEFGVVNPEKMDKLKIVKKDLPQEDTKVIILNNA